MVLNDDMAVAFTRALNDWTRAEWLDRDDRLRASIVLPMQDIGAAVEEIERLAPDRRFVQALVLAMGDAPLGKRQFWPVYEACVRHGLPLGIHAGSAYRHPQTSVGWTSWYLEEYAANQQAFQSQLASPRHRGHARQVPRPEGGAAGIRRDLAARLPVAPAARPGRACASRSPGWTASPAELVRDQVRLTVQPFDAPEDDPGAVQRILDHLRSDDMLLWASDWPHWQFDGDAAVPPGFPASTAAQVAARQRARHLRPIARGGGSAMNVIQAPPPRAEPTPASRPPRRSA